MSSGKRDFYGKEVTDAIKKACDTLQAPQEELAIEVVETGSMGIFGLIRKKAHIRAAVKGLELESNDKESQETVPPAEETVSVAREQKLRPEKRAEATVEKSSDAEPEAEPEPKSEVRQEPKSEEKPEPEKNQQPAPRKAAQEITAESVEIVREQLGELLRLMTFPSEVTAELDSGTIRLRVGEEHEEALTGQDGKIIDSLQYILRKLAARKIEEKIRLSIDIGEFREKRKLELMERARELAALVKEDGKTQAIPPLNPSERRIVHVALQEDKDIRSRSVGDGLFKKILIYKPGKGKKSGGSNKRGGRGRRGKSAKKPQENSES